VTSSPHARQGTASATRPLPSSPLTAMPPLIRPRARREPGSWTDDLSLATPAAVVRDLAYTSALLDGAERIRSEPDLPSLLSAVAAEAATLIQADDVAVIRYAGMHRVVLDVHVPSHIDDPALIEAVRAAGQEDWLVDPGSIADLADDRRWTSRRGPLASVDWRSVMTVSLDSPRPQEQRKLLWFSKTPQAFNGRSEVAGLFGRQANLVIQNLDERLNLALAIAARHRIGQAQGILMAKHHVTAEETFEMLRHASQNTNVKLHTVADDIISEFR
jgi:hypothetical protein